MNRILRIVGVLLSLDPLSGIADQGGDALKLLDDSGFNSASTNLTYTLTDAHEIDLRQGVNVKNAGENNSRWRGDTRGHYDFHYYDVDFGSGTLRPFVGANAEYIYGKGSMTL